MIFLFNLKNNIENIIVNNIISEKELQQKKN